MCKISLSWVIGNSASSKGGNQLHPDWTLIEQLLEQIRSQSGSVTLSVIDGSEHGPQTLQVITERGLSVLTLGENDDKGDYQIRSYTNQNAGAKDVAILGNFWSDKLVCTDFSVVRRAFKDFYDFGNVSSELLK